MTGVSPALAVDLDRVVSFRAGATRLDRRLPRGSHAAAARGGLQDTVPRAALVALHARMEGVGPASWEDPELVQVWFRWSDYVIPAADLAVFTLGALPRDPEPAAALDLVATAVADVLDGRAMPRDHVAAALPDAVRRRGGSPPHQPAAILRAANVAGRYRIRWDARTIQVVPAERPDADPEAARLELARRFLGWHGPATEAQFARWAGVGRADAARTWAALAPELIGVALDGRARHLLARDEDALRGAEGPAGVRLLPAGDPLLGIDRDLVGVMPDTVPEPARDDTGAPLTRRLVNSLGTRHVLGARVLVDGRIAGAWGRERDRLALYPWRRGDPDLERMLAEASTLAGPIGRPMRVRVLSGPGG